MTQQNLLDLAKQGNAQAIDVLLNRVFQLNGITAKTTIKDGYLHLLLESAQIPNQQTLVPAIRGAMANLGIPSVHSLMIYGRQTGLDQAAWTQTVPLRSHADLLPLTSVSSSVASSGMSREFPDHALNAVDPSPPTDPILTFEQLPLVEEHLSNGTNSPDVTNGNGLNSATVNRSDGSPTSEPAALEDELPPVEPHLILSADPDPIPPSSQLRRVGRSTNLSLLRNILLGLLGVMVLGILWLHNSVVAKQRATIDQAQRLSASAGTANNAKNLAALRASQQQLLEAETLLQSVPNVPASAQQQAEQELVKVRAQLADVQQKLDVEKQAQTDLQSAEKLVATATGLLQQSPRSPATSQQAEAKLQEAIRLLTAIPANTYVSAEAKQRLKMYKADYATVKEQSQKDKRKPSSVAPSKNPGRRK